MKNRDLQRYNSLYNTLWGTDPASTCQTNSPGFPTWCSQMQNTIKLCDMQMKRPFSEGDLHAGDPDFKAPHIRNNITESGPWLYRQLDTDVVIASCDCAQINLLFLILCNTGRQADSSAGAQIDSFDSFIT